MALGPCLNPNCKAHGKPHPNCHCYDGIGEHGNMAEGGKVKAFCDIKMPHKPDCEYYADGGDVAPPSYDDSQPQQPASQATPSYSDTAAGTGSVPKYEDSSAQEPPKYEDTHDQQSGLHTFVNHATNSALLGLGSAVNGLEAAGQTMVGDYDHPGTLDMGKIGDAFHKGMHEADASLNQGKETNPGSALTGDIAGTIASPANFVPFASPVTKVAVQSGAFATGDELHDYLSGDKSVKSMDDLKVSAMHIAGSAALGLLLGKGEKFVGDVASNFTNKASQFAEGVGASAHDLSPEQLSQLAPSAKFGYKLFKQLPKIAESNLLQRAVGVATGIATGTGNIGAYVGDKVASAAHDAIQPFIEKNISPFLDKSVKKVLIPVVLKTLQNESMASLPEAVNYAARAQHGRSVLNKSVMALFDKTPLPAKGLSEVTDKSVDELDKYIKAGGINPSIKQTIQQDNDEPESYAKGGKVSKKSSNTTAAEPLNSGLEHTYPEQHLLNVQAKTRLSNYLQSVSPTQPQGTAMFDPGYKDLQAERSYKRALHAAIDPMRFLEHAKKGTLQADHLKHMNSMYPEVMDATREQITKHLMDMKIKGEKPPLVMRQGLSMILGTSLDSSTMPANIMAAQATFTPKQQPGQQAPKNTNKLDKMSKDDTTATQAGTARRQGSKS